MIRIEKIKDETCCQGAKVAREAFTASRRVCQDQDAAGHRPRNELLGWCER